VIFANHWETPATAELPVDYRASALPSRRHLLINAGQLTTSVIGCEGPFHKGIHKEAPAATTRARQAAAAIVTLSVSVTTDQLVWSYPGDYSSPGWQTQSSRIAGRC
jgi:hypothetical protein